MIISYQCTYYFFLLVNGADRSPTSGGKEFFVDGDNFGPRDSAVHILVEYASDFTKPEFELFDGPGQIKSTNKQRYMKNSRCAAPGG